VFRDKSISHIPGEVESVLNLSISLATLLGMVFNLGVSVTKIGCKKIILI